MQPNALLVVSGPSPSVTQTSLAGKCFVNTGPVCPSSRTFARSQRRKSSLFVQMDFLSSLQDFPAKISASQESRQGTMGSEVCCSMKSSVWLGNFDLTSSCLKTLEIYYLTGGGETFQETLFQIAQAGYDAEWAVIPASDLGACHRRERIWIIAHANSGRQLESGLFLSAEERNGDGLESIALRSSGGSKDSDHASHTNNSRPQRQRPECELSESGGQKQAPWRGGGAMLSPEWRSYLSSPVLCRGDDGLRGRVDRLKQLGNSIVPQVAAVPLQRIKDVALGATQW